MATPDFPFIYPGRGLDQLNPHPATPLQLPLYSKRLSFPGGHQKYDFQVAPLVSYDWQLMKWMIPSFYKGSCSAGLVEAPRGEVACGPKG